MEVEKLAQFQTPLFEENSWPHRLRSARINERWVLLPSAVLALAVKLS